MAVVGLGPAGRALAHRLLAHGAEVLAVDPAPDRVWEPTYGGWVGQLPPWLPRTVVGAEAAQTRLIARGEHGLRLGAYAVLDNAALHGALDLTGAEVAARSVADEALPTLADVVVDCRGARYALDRHRPPMQTAYGVRLPQAVGRRLLDGVDATLMDWRPADGSPRWGATPPSFCYVIPLPDGRVLAEETCLAGDPAVEIDELARRLTTRLARYGIDAHTWQGAGDVEVVRIPMLPPPPSRLPRFGSAGGELNPITGYSVFASLAAADTAARSLLATGTIPRRRSPRRLALDALLGLAPDDVVDLFDAFGRLPAASQQAVFDPHASTARLFGALAGQWARMPVRAKSALVRATLAGAVR